MKSVRENASLVYKAIERYAQSIYGTTDSLKDMASESMITNDIVIGGIFSATGVIEAALAGLPYTVEQTTSTMADRFAFAFSQVGADFSLFVSDKITQGIGWIIENLDTLALAVTTVGGFITRVALLNAAAWAVMNWQIVLGVALFASVILIAEQMGVTISDVLNNVGGLFGWLYGIGYNVFASIHNVVADFFEFFVKFGENAFMAVGMLFINLFTTVLGLIETVASALDALFSTELAAGIAGFSNEVQGMVNKAYAEEGLTRIERIELKSVGETTLAGPEMFSGAGDKISAGIDKLQGLAAGGIPVGTAGLGWDSDDLITGTPEGKALKTKTSGKVDINTEDIKMLLDIATRERNLTYQTLTPQISINVDTIAQTSDINQVREPKSIRVRLNQYGRPLVLTSAQAILPFPAQPVPKSAQAEPKPI